MGLPRRQTLRLTSANGRKQQGDVNAQLGVRLWQCVTAATSAVYSAFRQRFSRCQTYYHSQMQLLFVKNTAGYDPLYRSAVLNVN